MLRRKRFTAKAPGLLPSNSQLSYHHKLQPRQEKTLCLSENAGPNDLRLKIAPLPAAAAFRAGCLSELSHDTFPLVSGEGLYEDRAYNKAAGEEMPSLQKPYH